jgi:hypothetical protein
MKFYTFIQNNSGGHFIGPRIVIIRANSMDEALSKAEVETDIYFDGCSKGIDCSCCGDRWSEYCQESDEPSYYGSNLSIEDYENMKTYDFGKISSAPDSWHKESKVLYVP